MGLKKVLKIKLKRGKKLDNSFILDVCKKERRLAKARHKMTYLPHICCDAIQAKINSFSSINTVRKLCLKSFQKGKVQKAI